MADSGESRRPAYVLVFVSARWCQISAPMRVIAGEILRDLAGRDFAIRGLEIDIDEAEAALADQAFDRLRPTGGSSADRPPHGLFDRPASATSGSHQAVSAGLDPVVTAGFVDSIDFIPMLVLLREGGTASDRMATAAEGTASDRMATAAEGTAPAAEAVHDSTAVSIDTAASTGDASSFRELARFAGQLPKLHIRAALLAALADGVS